MYKIGIITPKTNMFAFKPKYIYNEKHNIMFVAAAQNSNYKRIFKKNKINSVVKCIGIENEKVPVYYGTEFFKNNIIYFIAKQIKINYLEPDKLTLAIAFDNYDEIINNIVIQASKLFKSIVFVTENTDICESICDVLYENYGLYVITKSFNDIINCDMAAELTSSSIKYKNYPIIININSNIILPKEYNIFIPFKVNKLAVAEAIYEAKQMIDNLP